MADAQIAIIDGDPTQIAVIEGDQTQIVMAPGENPAIVTAIPGPQGPAGAVAAAIDGSAALPSIAFASDTDTGLYRVGANQLGVSTGGTQRLVIDASGQIEATSLGSAASPTWTFVGDPNTGIYSPGADQLALSTNGTGRLFVDASGNVGIGTTTSLNAFTLSRADNTGAIELRIDNTGSSYQSSLRFTGKDAGGLYPVVALIQGYQATNADSGELRFSTKPTGGSATERLRITSAGLVGIGTSSPVGNLDVTFSNSTVYSSSNMFAGGITQYIYNSSTTDGVASTLGFAAKGSGTTAQAAISAIYSSTGVGHLAFGTRAGGNVIERMRVTSTGLGIGTSTPGYLVTAATSADGVDGVSVESPSLNGVIRLRADGTNGNAIRVGGVGAQGNTLRFLVGSDAERMRIDSSGRLGIGTASPTALLHVQGTFSTRFDGNSIFLDRNGENYIQTLGGSSASLVFLGNGSVERARIDSSGRLLVGTSTARSNFGTGTQSARLQIEGTSGDTARIAQVQNANNANAIQYIFAKSRGTTVGSNTIVQSNDNIGILSFEGSDGTNFVPAAQITGAVDGTPGANDMPGRLVFSTTADGAASPTERMRLDRDGTLLLGVTTKVIGQTTNPYLFFQAQSNVTTAGMSIESYGNNTALRYHFAFTNPNGVVGTISTNGTATAYNTSSDYRLKENVTPVTDGITRLQQLKPSRFNFIADPDKTVDGFIAHEVQTIVPEAITGEKDAVDDDGNPVYQGIDQSKLVPLLTAALQEAIGEIESLKARVAALENA